MGKLVLTNTQHEEFVLEYLFGANKGNAARSYANVYYDGQVTSSCYSSSSKLLARPEIESYIAEKISEQKKISEYRKIHNVQILSDIIDEMATAAPNDQNGNPLSPHLCRQTAIRAIAEQNKLLGLNEEKADLTVNGGMNFTFNLIPPSDEDDREIEAEIRSIREEKGDYIEDVEYDESEENEEF